MPDRSLFLLPLLPLLSRLHPSLSLQSLLPTWWQLQSGFYLGEFFLGGGGGPPGGGAPNEKDRQRSPTSPSPCLLTSSDLSRLEEESQREGCYGEIPEPPFRFPPGGPPLHLRAPHSHLGALPTRSRRHTNFVPAEVVASGMFATQPLGRERGAKKKKKSKGFFFFSFKLDGLLPSCLSPPPLARARPRRPGPSIRPLWGPAFRLKADEGLQTKIGEDCVPLKASCRQWAGREAPGSPLPRPRPARAPPPPAPRETDKPAAGPTQSHASRTARARPVLAGPQDRNSGQAQPTYQPPSAPCSPPSSPAGAPEKKWEGVTGDACLAPALWE